MVESKWNVLLCKFNDKSAEPHPRQFYESLFTKTGNGKYNMVDFFYTMSHGKINIGNSKVFGWITLAHASSEVTAGNRVNIIQWARDSAANNSISLSSSDGLVIILNTISQTFAYLGSRLCVLDDAGWFPSISGQEMGHGFGLDHSRLDGSSQDYTDPWDSMSTWNSCYCADHADYVKIGPGLNAANMNSIGWLDHSRVWKNAGKDVDIEIILRPLHQRTLKGYLAALLNDYFWIEFRVNEGWDKEIPRPVVLVHYYFGGKSYLVKNSNGEKDGIKGSIYSLDSNVFPATWLAPPFQRIEVLDIDAKARIARIGIKSKKGKLSKANTNTFKEISKGSKGVTNDGGGWIIIGNQIIRIPPRTPQYDLLVGISNILAADNSEKIASKHSFRIKGYNKILKIAKEEIEHLHISEGVSDPK